MGYVKGSPQNPVIMFADGSEFLIMRSTPTVKNNIPYIKMIMSPFDWTMALLDLTDDDLSYDISQYGTLTNEYPETRIFNVSDNPEKPVKWCLQTYHGNPLINRKGEMDRLLFHVESVESLKARIAVQEMEISRLRKENMKYANKALEFFETQQSFTRGDRQMLPMSAEDLGLGDVEIKRRVQGVGK